MLPEDKGGPAMSKVGKIPTHDVSRKDTASMNSMEFNETLTICSSLLAKSIVKVSSDDIAFGFQDTTHDAKGVFTYRGLVPCSGVPFNEEVGPSSLRTKRGAKFVPRFSFSLAARNGLNK